MNKQTLEANQLWQQNCISTLCNDIPYIQNRADFHSEVMYRSNGQLLSNGSCELLENLIAQYSSKSFYEKIPLAGEVTHSLQKYIDFSVYEERLRKIDFKIDAYMYRSEEAIFVHIVFLRDFVIREAYGDMFSKEELIKSCDLLVMMLKSGSLAESITMDDHHVYADMKLAEWSENNQEWDNSPAEIRQLTIKFIQSIFNEDNFSEEKLDLIYL